MFAEFSHVAKEIFETAQREGRLTRNPDNERLRELTLEETGIVRTKYDSLVVESEPKSRAAMMTQNDVDTPFGEAERELLQQAKQSLAGEELVSIESSVADGREGITARLIVPRKFSHLAYGAAKLFKPAVTDNPTYQVVMFFDDQYEPNKSKPLPKKDITIRLAHSPDGHMVKIARNTNYFGEWKKGVFAGEERIVEELVLDLAGLGRITGGGLLRLSQHHEGRRLRVRQLGQGGYHGAAGDDEQVVDPRGVDVVAGVHEVATLDHRAAVAGQVLVVKIKTAVGLHVDIFQKRLTLQTGVIRFDLVGRVQGVGLDEQPTGLETAERTIAVQDAAVVLDEPRLLAALTGQDLAGGARLAVGA